MVESETSIAFEKSKEALTKEEQVKEKMAALRAKKKPPKMTGVHPSVLELPDDNVFSYKNVYKIVCLKCYVLCGRTLVFTLVKLRSNLAVTFLIFTCIKHPATGKIR